MIRARLTNGSFVLGIDAENVKRLTAGDPLVVDLFELGGKDKIMIMYGETLQEIVAELESHVGPLPPAELYTPPGEA